MKCGLRYSNRKEAQGEHTCFGVCGANAPINGKVEGVKRRQYMDKYIDNFCEEHFSDFEELGISNRADALFDNPCMRPSRFPWIAVGFSIVLLAGSTILEKTASETPLIDATFLKDIGIGLLSGSLVSLWFESRNKAIRYYEKIIGIITSRMQSISEARKAANEHLMNVSLEEGLQLLQYTAQNAYQFAEYIQDKMGGKVPLNLVEGIVFERDLDDRHTEEEAWRKVQKARQTIMKVQNRLSRAKTVIRMYAWGERSLNKMAKNSGKRQ